MKMRTLLLTVLYLIPLMQPVFLVAQGIQPANNQEEARQVEADTLPPQPFPGIGITSEFENTSRLLSESAGKHLSQETVAAFRTEADTLSAQIQGFLIDTSNYSLKEISTRELDQLNFRAQYFTDQIDALQGRLSGISDELESVLMGLQKNRERWRLTQEGAIDARSRRMRSMAIPKSTRTPSGTWMPNSAASRTAARARAAPISALEGTQPTFRQSPPMRCRSTKATFAPKPAAPAALTRPAVPAPMTTRL